MRNLIVYLIFLFLASCTSSGRGTGKDIITVSISPFKYFIEAIAGNDFEVNVMVPSGADPHIYEPAPGQIAALSKSKAYISDGYLGFEITWLDRFFEANKKMKKIALSGNIDLIKAEGDHADRHSEGADPHYWVSPKMAIRMAATINTLLCSLKPEDSLRYKKNLTVLCDTIISLDKLARELFSDHAGKPFMIFHPSLGYIARDYNLIQLAVEKEGKEPSPSYMKELIDEAKSKNIRIIFIQKGFDTKNALAIASETGASLVDVDPLGENWYEDVSDILKKIHESVEISIK